MKPIEKPKYESAENLLKFDYSKIGNYNSNLADLLKDKSEKQIKIQPMYGEDRPNDLIATVTDRIGDGYVLLINDGRITDIQSLGAGKEKTPISKKVAKEYIDLPKEEAQDFSYRLAA